MWVLMESLYRTRESHVDSWVRMYSGIPSISTWYPREKHWLTESNSLHQQGTINRSTVYCNCNEFLIFRQYNYLGEAWFYLCILYTPYMAWVSPAFHAVVWVFHSSSHGLRSATVMKKVTWQLQEVRYTQNKRLVTSVLRTIHSWAFWSVREGSKD